jgi:hypothetical protein
MAFCLVCRRLIGLCSHLVDEFTESDRRFLRACGIAPGDRPSIVRHGVRTELRPEDPELRRRAEL